jgi:hypothetical protein
VLVNFYPKHAKFSALLCHAACGCRYEPSEGLPPGPRQASICSIHGTVKTLSDLLHLHCGTASQIISGLKIASLNSRVFCSPGLGPNVAVLHVDD